LLFAVGSENQYRLAGIPKKFWIPAHDEMQDDVLTDTINSYLAQFSKRVKSGMGLSLFGDPGVGKSHGLARIAVEGIRRKKRVRWVPASILAGFGPARWDAKHVGDMNRYQEISERWKNHLKADILIIDDFNRTGISKHPAHDQVLQYTLRYRLDNEKATFITSNHSKSAFAREFCEEWVSWQSELNEMILVRGDSLRPRIYKRKLAEVR
jgi:DNA replication protein DnaC